MLLFFPIVIFGNKLCANNSRNNKNKSKPCLAETCLGKHEISARPEKSIFPKERRIFLPGGGSEVTMHMVLALWTYPTHITPTSHQSPDAALESPACETVLCGGQSGAVWPRGNNSISRIKENQRRTQCDPELKLLSHFCLWKQLLRLGSALQVLLDPLMCTEPSSCIAFLYLGPWNGGLAFLISTFETLDFVSLFLIAPTSSLTIMQNPNSIPTQGGLESQR